MLCRTAELVQEQVATPAGPSKAKGIVIKIIALTAISLALGFAHSWASTRYYQPDYVAGTTIHLAMTYISGPNGPSSGSAPSPPST